MAGLADLLQGINATFSDPSNAGLTGFAQGLLQAGAPHMMTPVTGGQALGMGAEASQQYQSQALQNAMSRLAIPFQQMKVMTFAKAMKTLNDPKASAQDKAAAQALAANLISPGMGPSMLSNSPTIQGAREKAISTNKPITVPPSARVLGPVGAPSVGAQGALPEGTQQPLGKLDLSFLPGAPQAIAANAENKAGGAASATYPYQAALAYHTRPLTAAGGTLGPTPPPFAPVGVPPQAQPPNPTQVAAAIAAMRQRRAAMAQAMNAQPGAPPMPMQPPAAQPGAAPPQAAPQALAQAGQPPAAPPMAPGTAPGLMGPGMTPSQVTGQQEAQKLATTQLSQDVTAGQEAQQRVANLEELNAVAGNLKTGPGVEGRIAAMKALASIPGAIGASAGNLRTITNAQIFNKTALNLSLQTVSSAGQHAYDAFKSVMNAFPELSKTNLANAVVTGSLLATARYQADKGNFAAKWQQQNQGMGFVPGKGTAEGAWTQNAPFMAYFMNALPPEAQAMIVQKAKTNATLRIELKQAAQGWRWLNANGY